MNVLITGAKGGIGYQLGIKLAKKKHLVYMTTHTNKQSEQLAKQINHLNLSNQIKVLKLDITNKNDLNIIDTLDIDAFFVHASIGEGGSILEIPIDKLKYNYEVNIFSNIELIKRYIKTRSKNKKAKIIVTSSLAGIIPIPYLGSYTSSKVALSMIVKTLHKELKSSRCNIKIHLIEPGAYRTGFNQVMINKIGNYDSEQKQLKIHQLFDLIECKSLDSVVNKMIFLAENNSRKVIHRTPLLQKILIKLYLLFFA